MTITAVALSERGEPGVGVAHPPVRQVLPVPGVTPEELVHRVGVGTGDARAAADDGSGAC